MLATDACTCKNACQGMRHWSLMLLYALQAAGVLLALVLYDWIKHPTEPVPSAFPWLQHLHRYGEGIFSSADQGCPVEGLKPITDIPGPRQWPLVGNL